MLETIYNDFTTKLLPQIQEGLTITYELLSWKEWNGKDWVVGIGSSYVLDGSRHVPGLFDFGGRELDLRWWGGRWYGGLRFLAVRTSSLKNKPSDSSTLSPDVETLTLTKAIEVVKEAGYKIYKEI